MKWEFAILVAGVGGAAIGALSAIYARRETPPLPVDRAIAGALLGAGAVLVLFLVLSAVVGLLYFARGSRSWWPTIALTWLVVAALGAGYAFPGAKIGRRY